MYLYSWLGLASFLLSFDFVSCSQRTLTPDSTTVLSAVNLQPTLIWQSGQAGESPLLTSSFDGQLRSKSSFIPAATAIAQQEVSLSYTIPLLSTDAGDPAIFSLCWYPVSGYYGLLSRVLFYATMLFAVFARRHQWLIIGALAASMTYAGTAAIHGCIIVWSNSGMGNNDTITILGILLFASAMIVPLLTWSRTVKDIGKTYEEESIGRSIIIAWSFLIFVGFITMFVGLVAGRLSQNASYGHASIHVISPAFSYSDNFTCTPPQGILDLTVGQNYNWSALYPTREFIDYNRCTSPCGKLKYGTLMKPVENLVPLTRREVDYWFEIDSNLQRENRALFTILVILFGGLAMCWSILQSLTIIFFGRRSPIQIRNQTYMFCFKILKKRDPRGTDLSIKNHYIPHLLAKGIAYTFYSWGVATTVVSAIIVVGSITATELVNRAMPQSSRLDEVDAWSAWVATGLILLTASLYRFEGIFEDCIMRFLNFSMSGIYRCCHGRRKAPKKAQPSEKGPAALKQNKNRSILMDIFYGSIQHYIERIDKLGKKPVRSWQDSLEFWHDSLKTAQKDLGRSHNRRRKVVNIEGQKFPTGWKQDGLDDWLSLEDFVKACQKYDESWRVDAGNKGHKGYKWQPRVIPDDGIVDALRTEFDVELLKDIFSRSKQKTPDHEALLGASASTNLPTTNNGQTTSGVSDNGSAHGVPMLITAGSSHDLSDQSAQGQAPQEQRAATKVVKEPSQISPIHRAATVVTISEQSALLGPEPSVTDTSEDLANAVRHAATFPASSADQQHSNQRAAVSPTVFSRTNLP